MPYKKRYRKKRSTNYKKKVYKKGTYNKRLRDKSINTLIEKKIVAISRSEINKHKVILCKRDHIYAGFDRLENLFTGQGRLISYNGGNQVTFISGIPIADVATVAAQWLGLNNLPIVNDPNLSNQLTYLQQNAGMGPNLLAVQQANPEPAFNGWREGSQVIITGISLNLKVYGEIWALNLDPIPTKLYDDVHLFFKVVAVKNTQGDETIAFHTPTLNDLIPYNNWGYTKVLDDELTPLLDQIRYKTLLKGKISYKPSERTSKHIFRSYRTKFKTPLKMNFKTTDKSGHHRTTDWKIYIVFRSNIPDIHADTYAPAVCACTRLWYYNN